MKLLTPIAVGGRHAPNRVVFGPHETNLGAPGPNARALSPAHVAYYARRAAGGCGLVVTETASVHDSDWPYERAPLAARCEAGWAAVALAVHRHGGLALASLGHSGLQGSSAYSQRELWGPSRFPDPVTREVPMAMGAAEIAELRQGFADAAARAVATGMDGVEIEAGANSLLRQFVSGLSNSRTDAYGHDRTRLLREVLSDVRAAVEGAVVGLRVSCDEQAPWAGITPEGSREVAAALAGPVDYIVAVRAGPYDAFGTRPDTHVEPGFAIPLAAGLRQVLDRDVLVVAQGSIVEPELAESACATVDLVEMTRAQIADPDLVRKLADPSLGAPRPCIRCNQTCRVRDSRNPIITCVGEPRSGHEMTEPDPAGRVVHPRRVLVVGAGPAGLEAARVAASRGHIVRVVEQADTAGGAVRSAARGAARAPLTALTDWMLAECVRHGVEIAYGNPVAAADVDAAEAVVLATGSRAATPSWAARCALPIVTARAYLDGASVPAGPVVVDDPVGGPVGVSVAERLAAAGVSVTFVTQDVTAGTQLSRTGDLAAASSRLARAGVVVRTRTVLRAADSDGAVLEDRYTGAQTVVPATAVIDAGHALPAALLSELRADGTEPGIRVGDAVAPRTIAEAILEGRRAAMAIGVGIPGRVPA